MSETLRDIERRIKANRHLADADYLRAVDYLERRGRSGDPHSDWSLFGLALEYWRQILRRAGAPAEIFDHCGGEVRAQLVSIESQHHFVEAVTLYLPYDEVSSMDPVTVCLTLTPNYSRKHSLVAREGSMQVSSVYWSPSELPNGSEVWRAFLCPVMVRQLTRPIETGVFSQGGGGRATWTPDTETD